MSSTPARQRFLDSAGRLLQERGYHGTGLRDVLADSGAPRGSLYFHFPGGKEQLAAEAVAQGGAAVCAAMREVLSSDLAIGDAVRAIVAAFSDQLESSDFTLGCPIAPVALEHVDGAQLGEAVRTAFGDQQAVIAERLRAEGHHPQRAESLAGFTLSAIEGALLLAKVRRDLTPLRDAAEELAVLLAVPAGDAR